MSEQNTASIIIPKGTEIISDRQYEMHGLKHVIIPDSVTSIGMAAFANNNLTSVIISPSVRIISDLAFANNNLTSVTIPDSVISIGYDAFIFNNLTSITIPNTVTSIGNQAFCYNGELTSVTIEYGVKSIGYEAFENTGLTSVTIPDSVTSIGMHAFNCYNLTKAQIPERFNTDYDKTYLFGHNFTKITFTITPPTSESTLEPTSELTQPQPTNPTSQKTQQPKIPLLTTGTVTIDDLFTAITKNDDKKVKKLINAGINVNSRKNGETALIFASKDIKREKCAIALIEKGADIKLTDNNNKNAMMWAFEEKCYNVFIKMYDKQPGSKDETAYKNLIKGISQKFYNLLIDEKPEFLQQIRIYINNTHDYFCDINKFVDENVKREGKVLIVDFDNLAYNTRERQKSIQIQTLLTEGPRSSGKLLPNVKSDEMIEYKSAVISVLRYAKENKFESIIIIAKDTQFQEQFQKEYEQLKKSGIISSVKRDNKNTVLITAEFTDKELQIYLNKPEIKVSLISVKSKIDYIKMDDTLAKKHGISQMDFNKHIHRLKGTDDSLVILISNAILERFGIKASLMSGDSNIIGDFKQDYLYICPFATKIEVNGLPFSEFIVNHRNNINHSVIQKLIETKGISKELFDRIDPFPLNNLIDWYYKVSEPDGTGFKVKNWYSRDLITSAIESRFNIDSQPNDNGKSIDYVTGSNPTLNPSGKPHLSRDGLIAKLEYNKKIPYLIETWDDINKKYTYTPAKDGKGNYYKTTNGKNDTIKVFEWQPYAKKYISTNNSSGEHLEYYQKYMKYKAKYNELKKKLGL
jgi:hypothetical protein